MHELLDSLGLTASVLVPRRLPLVPTPISRCVFVPARQGSSGVASGCRDPDVRRDRLRDEGTEEDQYRDSHGAARQSLRSSWLV